MKKVSLILAFMIIALNVIPSVTYGEKNYDEKLKEVVLKAKELFEISSEYDEFNSNVNSYDGNTKFYLNWSDTKGKLNNVNISMDIDGNVISYNSYSNEYENQDQKLPNYTQEQAKGLAMDFIEKVSPDIKSIKISEENQIDNLYNQNYNFNYIRYVNGIEYKQNRVNIEINKYTGEIRSYYVEWERNIEFPSSDKIIKENGAKEIFKNKIGLKPVYKIKTNHYREINKGEPQTKYYLAYTLLESNKGIDALTGDKININYYSPYYNESEADGAIKENITPEEQESIDELKNILSDKQAEGKARKILNIEDSYELQNQNLYKNYKNKNDYIWNMYFAKKDKKFNVSIAIDAKTGELLNFHKSLEQDPDDKSTIDEKAALEMARKYLKKQNLDKIDEVELIENEYKNYQNEEPKNYYFRFIRKTDGIYVEDDSIYIGVDAVNEEINSYSIDWYKGEFPSSEKMISVDEAYDILWEEIGLNLMYIKLFGNDDLEKLEKDMKVKLVYTLNQEKPSIIDGSTGEILDYSGEPYVEIKPITYSDIEKSYAKEKINILANYGIGFKDEEFKPNKEIKQSEYIYLLWKSRNQYRTDDTSQEDIYKDFIRAGYIEEAEKSPDSIITKGEAVKYIIRMMNLREVAEINGIYKDIFADEENIKEELKGYINIAYGLDIIKGNGTGNINPDYKLKREDAASMIYNYIFR